MARERGFPPFPREASVGIATIGNDHFAQEVTAANRSRSDGPPFEDCRLLVFLAFGGVLMVILLVEIMLLLYA